MKGYQAIKSLGKRKLSTSLMIFQLTSCVLCFLILCQFIYYYNTRYKLYTEIMDEDHTIVVDQSTVDKDLKRKKKTLDEIFKLKDSGVISEISIVSKMGESFEIGEKYYPCYQLSENMLNKLNIELEKGRSFTKDELEVSTYRQEIPIIIGNRLGNYLKVGDTVSTAYNYADENGEYCYKRILKVIGIAKYGKLVTFAASSNPADIFINDYGIYAPLSVWKYYLKDNTHKSIIIERNIESKKAFGLQYELQDNLMISNNSDYLEALLHDRFQILISQDRDTEAVKEIINDICKKNKANIRFQTLKQTNEIMGSLFSQGLLAILTLTIILFVFSIAGIIGTTLYSINMRRKEFGIRISQGATLNDIAFLILKEILLNNVLALILAVTSFKLVELYISKYLGSKVEYTYLVSVNFSILMMVFGMILFSSLVTSIIPMRRIMRLDVIELIRGDRG